MRIVFLSFFSGMVYRGGETYVHELANHLVALGHSVLVYQNGPSQFNAKYETISIGMKTDFHDRGGWSIGVSQLVDTEIVRRFTGKVLKKIDDKVDVIIPTNNRLQAILVKFWAKRNRVKVVISGQGGIGWDDKLALWTFPDVYVPLTQFQLDWANKINPRIRKEKIPNGVNLKLFEKKAANIEIDLPRPIVLCAAALVPSMKRQPLLIRAMAKMDLGSLLLVGKGDGHKEIEELGQSLLGGRFKLISFPHHQMPQIYQAADLFSFPTSPWESFGIVCVEAMASGLAVVASDDPIRREIVGEAGLFVDPTDSDAYAKTLQKALETDWQDKPLRQADKFSWDKIASQYDQLFRGLVKKAL